MENYTKGSNIEKQLELSDVPIKDLPTDVTWMKVKPGSKMDNLITFALQLLQTGGKTCQLWTGIGPAIGKKILISSVNGNSCKFWIYMRLFFYKWNADNIFKYPGCLESSVLQYLAIGWCL